MHLQPETAGGRGLTLHLDPAVGVTGEAQASVALPPCCVARLRFELVVKLDGIAKQARDVGVGPQLAHEPGCMPRRAGSELMPLDEQRFHAELGQMIGDSATDDPTADDDDLGALRQLGHVFSISSNATKAASKRRRFSSV